MRRQSGAPRARGRDDHEKFSSRFGAARLVSSPVLAVDSETRFAAHVQSHTVVLPRQRVLFLPMPKAACTSVLWALAELAGMTPEDFEGSTLPEPSAALTVHDMNAWAPGPPARAVRGRGPAADPGATTGCASRSCATPGAGCGRPGCRSCCCASRASSRRTASSRGSRGCPSAPPTIVEDFRRFVAALGAGEAEDVHWAVQHDLSSQLPLTHVGRAERLGDTMRLLLRARGRRAGAGRAAQREPARAAAGRLRRGVGRDRAATLRRGLRRPSATTTGRLATARAPSGTPRPRPCCRCCARRSTGTCASGSCTASRSGAPSACRAPRRGSAARPGRSPVTSNLEGHARLQRALGLGGGPAAAPGLTAIVRVKNEARALPWTLPPLLRAADRVTLIDNGSTDGTARVAREIAGAEARGGELPVRGRALRRRAPVDARGVRPQPRLLLQLVVRARAHDLRAQVGRRHGALRPRPCRRCATWPGSSRPPSWSCACRASGSTSPSDRLAYVDTALRNCEPWAWPNRPGYRFVKALEWELPMFPPAIESVTLPEFSCVELKFLDGDEFGHWSPTDFAASPRTARKRREQEVFRALAAGERPPDGVVAVEAPRGRARDRPRAARWLPAAAGAGARPQPRRAGARARAPPPARASARGCRARRDRAAGRRARPRPGRARRTCTGRVRSPVNRGIPCVPRPGGPSSSTARRADVGERAKGSSERPSSANGAPRARGVEDRRGEIAVPDELLAPGAAPGRPGPRISSGTRIDGS